MASNSRSRIVELANLISSNTAIVDTNLREHHLPQPSFDADGPLTSVPNGAQDIETARNVAVEASIELQQLLQGVDSLLTPVINMTGLAVISRFKIASKVPIGGEISFSDLAELCGLYEHDLSRIIRFSIAHHRVFQEPRKGIVAHSAASKRLADSEGMQHMLGLTFEEIWPAQPRTVDALIKFRKSQEPNATGFALANDTTLPFYEFLEHHPERAKRFSGAMSSGSFAGLDALAQNFPRASIPDGGLVVDIGGSQGHVSAFLAERFPSLKFVVQDLPEVIADKDSTYRIPETLTDRVALMGHDFFSPQPLRDVDTYVIRYIFHNWSDEYSIKILRNLIPGLKQGAKILVQDHLLPEPNTLSLIKERDLRTMDLIMLSTFNSRERDIDDWKTLFKQADPRFNVESVKRQAPDSPSGIALITWEG